VGYRETPAVRPTADTLAARAERLSRPLAPGETIDVDRASVEELTRLPRIGPALAQRIVADRTARGSFGSLAELDSVSGIGPALLDGLRRYVTFSGPVMRERALRPTRVRVNTASAGDLAGLPGIGPARAAAIVASRRQHGPFRQVEDLQRVPGIGPKTVEQLRNLVQLP
jgi:competence protein ComEA